MKKKLKDITLQDAENICKKHECERCPLFLNGRCAPCNYEYCKEEQRNKEIEANQ